jgi:hypothetical protein
VSSWRVCTRQGQSLSTLTQSGQQLLAGRPGGAAVDRTRGARGAGTRSEAHAECTVNLQVFCKLNAGYGYPMCLCL